MLATTSHYFLGRKQLTMHYVLTTVALEFLRLSQENLSSLEFVGLRKKQLADKRAKEQFQRQARMDYYQCLN